MMRISSQECESRAKKRLVEKKKRELRQIKEFCRLAELRLGECRCSENPDWLIELDQGGTVAKIGVEVRELPGDRGLLAAWRRVKESLRNIARTRPELQNIIGLVFLVEGRLPPKHKCATLANELAEFATAQPLKSGDEAVLRKPFGDGYPLMNQFVRRLWLWNRGYSIWQCDDLAIAWVGLSVPSLEAAIREKTSKAKNYRTYAFDELWLLLVSGAEAGDVQDSSGPDCDGEVAGILKRVDVTAAPFHKVFVFEMIDNWAYEVRPRVQRLMGAPKAPDARSDAQTRRAP